RPAVSAADAGGPTGTAAVGSPLAGSEAGFARQSRPRRPPRAPLALAMEHPALRPTPSVVLGPSARRAAASGGDASRLPYGTAEHGHRHADGRSGRGRKGSAAAARPGGPVGGGLGLSDQDPPGHEPLPSERC